jgi:hypothetical protein
MIPGLFTKVARADLDPICREWFDWLTNAGFPVTAWRYVPTGKVDLVLHHGPRPADQTLCDMAEVHLAHADIETQQ